MFWVGFATGVMAGASLGALFMALIQIGAQSERDDPFNP